MDKDKVDMSAERDEQSKRKDAAKDAALGAGQAAGKQAQDAKWADEAAKARTSDDPRARTPGDATGQPSGRTFDE